MSDVSISVIMINIFGLLVSLFSIYVTLRIYRTYKLTTSIFFIVTTIAIFVWNLLHLVFNFIEEDALDFGTIRFLWLSLVYSGILFVFSFIYGYSNLRYEFLNWRLVLYAGLGSAFAVLFVTEENSVNVGYIPEEGYGTVVENSLFWAIFSLSIFIVSFVEVILPLIETYNKTKVNRRPLIIMIISIILALLSNGLEPLLTQLSLPQAIRFLFADFGFLFYFMILLRYPFTGLLDNSVIDRVLITDKFGNPKLTYDSDSEDAVLASGAIIGVNSILEEITASTRDIETIDIEATRRIELGDHQFFIIIRGSLIIVFQFHNPSGVCYSKFLSLGRIFALVGENDISLSLKFHIFKEKVKEYFGELEN